MQNEESVYPNDWFAKGDNDLNAAKVLLKAKILQSAAFHIQQGIEKYLKGYLLSKGWKLHTKVFLSKYEKTPGRIIFYPPQ